MVIRKTTLARSCRSLDPKTARTIMRLITELARERSLPTIVNMHDVALAKLFATRIVGLRPGAVVFDVPPGELTNDTLTEIYGEEDWNATGDDDPTDRRLRGAWSFLARRPLEARGRRHVPGDALPREAPRRRH